MPVRSRSTAGDFASYLVLVVIGLWFIVPIFWIFSTSLKPTPEILVTPMTLLPKHLTLEHYATALSSDFRAYLTNSLIAATGATAIGLALSIPARIWLRKIPLPGIGNSSLVYRYLTRFPTDRPRIAVLPTVPGPWPDRQSVGLGDRLRPDCAAADDLDVARLLSRLPDELLDAAKMDGLGVVQTLIRIVIPLSLPGLGVATLFGFLIAWNEFILALTLTRNARRPNNAGRNLSTLITQFQVQWGEMMGAVAAIYLLPVFAVTLIAQRGLVRGLMIGAVKA